MRPISPVAKGNDLGGIDNVFTGMVSVLARPPKADGGDWQEVCDERSLLNMGSMRCELAEISVRIRNIPNEIRDVR